jgi:hypothetical protein
MDDERRTVNDERWPTSDDGSPVETERPTVPAPIPGASGVEHFGIGRRRTDV